MLLPAALCLAGCDSLQQQHASAPKVAPKAEPEPDHREERKRALLDTDMDFARTSEEKGAPEAFAEFLAADAMLLPEGELPIQGRDAIKVHQAAGPQGLLTWKPRGVEIAGSGDLGYTWGAYEFREKNPDGRPAVHNGKYVTTWRKQADGSWKAALLIKNASPSAEERR